MTRDFSSRRTSCAAALTSSSTHPPPTEPIVDPFHEVFDEEEVVVDRYALVQVGTFANRQMVSSQEGREIARMLPPASAVVQEVLAITGKSEVPPQ